MRDPSLSSGIVSEARLWFQCVLLNFQGDISQRLSSANRKSQQSVHHPSCSNNLPSRMFNYGVSVVLRSENPDISVGDHLYSHNTSEFNGCYGVPNMTTNDFAFQDSRNTSSNTKRNNIWKLIMRKNCLGRYMLARLACLVCWLAEFVFCFPSIKIPDNTGQTAVFGWQEYSAAKKVNICNRFNVFTFTCASRVMWCSFHPPLVRIFARWALDNISDIIYT